MNEPATVTYNLAEVLKRIEDKIDSNHKELSQKIDKQSEELSQRIDKQSEEIGTIKVKLTAIETEVKNLNQDVRELKGSTKAQIWTLIGILITAVGGFLVAVARFVFYPIT
ncbi:MAG: hemolysin XhlA family protein [Crocosphaera sp.]|nr:hemolysin XhlA family protein [Crocosphaera sp.]